MRAEESPVAVPVQGVAAEQNMIAYAPTITWARNGRHRTVNLRNVVSIVGSVFEGSYRKQGGRIVPVIKGSAWIDAEATLIVDPSDPFRMGIRR